MKTTTAEQLKTLQVQALAKLYPQRPVISVGLGTCGSGNGAQAIYDQFAKEIKSQKLKIILKSVGCFGYCAQEPLVMAYVPGRPLLVFSRVTPKDIKNILAGLKTDKPLNPKPLAKIEAWDHLTISPITFGADYPTVPPWQQLPFFKGQQKLVLRDCGLIDPENINEYLAVGGYSGLLQAIRHGADTVLQEIHTSKLRGRGGAGFPVGRKWELMKNTPADQKYVICNADEGDPGAYMNRNEIESDPHMLIEGLAIGAFVMGASLGIVYIRAEYPLAVKRLKRAIEAARAYGFLGTNIFNSAFSFDLELVEGAGAFVCGEETALIASIEGKAGRPKPRPPFPAQSGLYGKPTNINNVETWCNVPLVLAKGGQWFTQFGTEKSTGTKVFSLVGKVKNTGLVEMPMGSKLSDIIYGNGESTGTRKKVKAVQTGGPSGGCIPAELFNTAVDYESLAAIGAIMGSGGMVVMDQDNCMVDVARYFLEFTTAESCGKCVPCREGLVQLLAIVKNIAQGRGQEADLAKLKQLCSVIKDSALCGLGQTGPNPVLTTMQYFANEYAEHIKNKHCAAGVCQELFISPCENSCPLHMNVPGYVELYKEGRLVEAFDLILRDNPLPASLGRICHFHCKMRCRREDLDDTIKQGEVHRFIADTVYQAQKETTVYKKLIAEKFPATGKKIAIVGAGPAGLTAAYYLVRLGHAVVVYDSATVPGGILHWGIPEYRLPKKLLAKELQLLTKLGIKFSLKKTLDAEKLKQLAKSYDRIFLSLGAQKNLSLDIPGEELQGVTQGLKYLHQISGGEKVKTGKKVLIIGGGNVAIDAARTAWRKGAKVTVVYRRDRAAMPANKHEIEAAYKEGIRFEFYAAPQEILGQNGNVTGLTVKIMQPGEWDISGRRKPVPTTVQKKISCDQILLAIGEKVDTAALGKGLLNVNKNGTVIADIKTYATNDPKIYAGGDLISGPATAAEAMAHGKYAARAIDQSLVPIGKKDQPRFSRLFNTIKYNNEVPVEPCRLKTCTISELSVSQRKASFQEVSLGLTAKQTSIEAERCLRCDVKEVSRSK